MNNDRILLLGEPGLRVACAPVADPAGPGFAGERERLVAVLECFRLEHGFGRGIAAPQIGIPRRLIALQLGGRTRVLGNPEIVWHSEETFTLWDDCMSFPDLLVRVRRFASVTVVFHDEKGRSERWERLAPAESELLQHEIDHLDGILAVDRALDNRSLVWRTAFEQHREHFRKMVDRG